MITALINIYSVSRRLAAGLLLSTAAMTSPAQAQQSNESLAQAAQNPIADMISLPFQNNTNLRVGPKDQAQNVLNVQPVYPIHINSEWNLITRTIVPVLSQPDFGSGAGRTDGIGDVQFSAFLSPARSSGWIWGVGAIAQVPTATNDVLGQGKWALGPTAIALHMEKGDPWVYGALVNNVWSVAGKESRPSVNQMAIQPFLNYNFRTSPGRYLTYSPVITADWKANSHDRWTVPLGLGIGQIFRVGRQPVNAQVSLYNNVVRPDNGAEWQLRVQVTLLFPR